MLCSEHRISCLQDNAHVIIIHHTGKTHSSGARGSSSLQAAVDTEIELRSASRNTVEATIKKQREGTSGATFRFGIQPVKIGTDSDGDTVTSAVIVADGFGNSSTTKGELSVQTKKAFRALKVLIEKNRTTSVAISEWRSACDELPLARGISHHGPSQAFSRAKERLENEGLIWIENDRVGICQ